MIACKSKRGSRARLISRIKIHCTRNKVCQFGVWIHICYDDEDRVWTMEVHHLCGYALFWN